MEKLIYPIVKGLSAAYIIYKVYRFLSGQRTASFLRFLTPENSVKEKAPVAIPEPAAYSVVGKSQTVYLEKPPKVEAEAIEPAFSENLKKVPVYEEEPDITDNDVDDNLNEDRFSEEERFLSLDADTDDGDFPSSTGMTYEQISQALDVVRGKQTDEADKAATARILYEVQGSDLFNFLAAQAENEAIVEKLIRESIDCNGGMMSENINKQRRKNRRI